MISLAAYVYASITTESHEFDEGFAVLLFVADLVTASAVGPGLN